MGQKLLHARQFQDLKAEDFQSDGSAGFSTTLDDAWDFSDDQKPADKKALLSMLKDQGVTLQIRPSDKGEILRLNLNATLTKGTLTLTSSGASTAPRADGVIANKIILDSRDDSKPNPNKYSTVELKARCETVK
jgi:hypothetical protein